MAQPLGEARGHLAWVVAGYEVYAGAVQGDRDGLRQEGAVVTGSVPGHSALVAGGKPEFLKEIYCVCGLGTVQRYPPVFVHLLAAEAPQKRVGETGSIAESVSQSLPDRHANAFQLLAGLKVLLPGFRRA